jgi:hypothetical protein
LTDSAVRDRLALASLLLAAAILAWWRIRSDAAPVEDAAMLLRYSENLAQGHGIVWNVSGPPEDGATDFLFMLLVALVRRLGLGLVTAGQVISVSFHLATVAVVYLAIANVARAPRLMAFLSAIYIAAGPGPRYIEAGFGTTVFAFFVALTALSWIALLRPTAGRAASVRFSISCLAMGLARPEGVALALFLLISAAALVGFGRRTAIVMDFAMIFGLLGLTYFVWHWAHFGYPLPNPVYVRAVHGGHLRSLRDAIKNALILLLPLTPPVLLTFFRGDRRAWPWLILPVAAFVSLWSILSHSMNFMMRYQYTLVPLALITWAPAFARLSATLGSRERAMLMTLSAAAAAFTVASVQGKVYQIGGAGWRNIGLALARFPHSHTMITTEAGQLPLYSGWRAIDAGGLNDSWIAHHGLTDDYLEAQRASIIMVAPAAPQARLWRQMTDHLQAFARSRRYQLAVVFGSEREAPVEFYVVPWLPESAALIEALRTADPGLPIKQIPRAAP